jgi:hypothetical protein
MTARRARVHSRDLQPLIATPKGLIAAARVQRFDWPINIPTTEVDELGRKLHVGTTQELPSVTVTLEAFDVSHNTYSMLTGYTPSTFPASGVSILDFKSVDVIGHIRDTATQNVVNALYVKRAAVTGMDLSFGVTANSTATYTFTSTSKKELKQPVRYDSLTISSASGVTLSQTPSFLIRTSGYILDCYSNTEQTYLNEGTDFTVTGTAVRFTDPTIGDNVWVTYCSATAQAFAALDNAAPAAISGKYVPLKISVNNISRVQSATIKAAMAPEQINEMGALGVPVATEFGTPAVTGDITVLKTDNDLVNILTGQAASSVETDISFALNTLPLKIQLLDPRDVTRVVLTYYVPSIAITTEGDSSSVNQSVQETFGWQSTTGELWVASGSGPWA